MTNVEQLEYLDAKIKILEREREKAFDEMVNECPHKIGDVIAIPKNALPSCFEPYVGDMEITSISTGDSHYYYGYVWEVRGRIVGPNEIAWRKIHPNAYRRNVWFEIPIGPVLVRGLLAT